MSNKKLVAVGVVVLALVAAVFGFLMWNKGGDEAEAGSPVSFTVNAEGWSEETSSPIPIQVTGETETKEKVDEKYFLGVSDKDLVLKPGTYDVAVYASPVNADGGMYRCPNAVKLSVPKATSKPQSKPSASASASAEAVVSVELDLSPVPANEITDEEIEAAQAAMKEAGLSEEEISTFVEAVRNARQAELDRIKAKEEEERKAKEAEEQSKVALSAIAGTYAGGSGLELTIASDGTLSSSVEYCHGGSCVLGSFTGRLEQVRAIGNGTYNAVVYGAYANQPDTTVTCPAHLADYAEYGCSNIDLGLANGGTITIYAAGQPKPQPGNESWYGSTYWTPADAVSEPETGPLQHMALVAGDTLYLRE